jgi:hypothetical protein
MREVLLLDLQRTWCRRSQAARRVRVVLDEIREECEVQDEIQEKTAFYQNHEGKSDILVRENIVSFKILWGDAQFELPTKAPSDYIPDKQYISFSGLAKSLFNVF